MKRANGVDDYIASAPKEVKEMLKALRDVIRTTAPLAEEKISYGIPYYGYKGRLAYFRYSTTYLGLYIPPPVVDDHKKELEGYVTATSTIRFPVGQKLPVQLIKKLIKARLKINEENENKK